MRWAAALASGVLSGGVAAASWPAGSAGAQPVSRQFSMAAVTSFSVPAGICSVTVSADGARGGSGSVSGDGQPANEGAGGAGVSVSAHVSVTPGGSLSVVVGGVGGTSNGLGVGAGGFGGGGTNVGISGGGGGGASSVATSSGQALVVAGGGFGGGGGGSSFVAAGATNVSSGVSSLSGDGQITISFDPASDGCPTGAGGPAAPVLVAPTFTG
jgi:hypothetical protein